MSEIGDKSPQAGNPLAVAQKVTESESTPPPNFESPFSQEFRTGISNLHPVTYLMSSMVDGKPATIKNLLEKTGIKLTAWGGFNETDPVITTDTPENGLAMSCTPRYVSTARRPNGQHLFVGGQPRTNFFEFMQEVRDFVVLILAQKETPEEAIQYLKVHKDIYPRDFSEALREFQDQEPTIKQLVRHKEYNEQALKDLRLAAEMLTGSKLAKATLPTAAELTYILLAPKINSKGTFIKPSIVDYGREWQEFWTRSLTSDGRIPIINVIGDIGKGRETPTPVTFGMFARYPNDPKPERSLPLLFFSNTPSPDLQRKLPLVSKPGQGEKLPRRKLV